MTPFTQSSSFHNFTRGTYVILMKDNAGRLTLLADPGMNRPWSSKNKRLADFHATECDGEAHTFESAWKLLIKENPGFEKELIERIKKKTTDTTKSILDANSLKHGINTNANHHRNSDGTILDASGNDITPTSSSSDS